MTSQQLCIAILTDNPHNATRDKQSCVKLNAATIKVFETLEQALDDLRTAPIHLLLIDTSLRDVSGCHCLKAIRKSMRIPVLPAIMVSADSSLQHVLTAIAAGCNGYVIRPYSQTTLERHIQLAFESTQTDDIAVEQLATANSLVEQGRFDDAIEEFTEIVEEENEAAKYFNMGMDYLHRQKFGKAIVSFNKAVAINSMYAEAYKGLAKAYQGKGDTEQYRNFLDKAAEVLAVQDRLDELKEVFAEILEADPEAVNPYNSLGINLRRKGDYIGALHAYNQALFLTPNDENLRYNIAKACIFAKKYEEAMEHLRQAIILRPEFTEAQALLTKLQTKHYDQLETPETATTPASPTGGLDMDV